MFEGRHGRPMTVGQRLAEARNVPGLVVLEGVHAVKHCVRFGGTIDAAWTADPDELARLLAELAPDVAAEVLDVCERIDASVWQSAVPRLRSPAVAIARLPPPVPLGSLRPTRPIVVLESPRRPGNVGAVIRVAAAADAAGVVTTGELDPWGAAAVRGAAGLGWALPVLRLDVIDDVATGNDRPVIAMDPAGEPFDAPLPLDAILMFGTERDGLSDAALALADRVVALPMRAGVSSLNLATSVAATLYRTW